MTTRGEEYIKALEETIHTHPSERKELNFKKVNFSNIVYHGADLAYITFESCMFRDCALFDTLPLHPEQFTDCKVVYSTSYKAMFGNMWDREDLHKYCEKG